MSHVGFPEEALEWRVQKEQSSQNGEAKTEAAEGPEDLWGPGAIAVNQETVGCIEQEGLQPTEVSSGVLLAVELG